MRQPRIGGGACFVVHESCVALDHQNRELTSRDTFNPNIVMRDAFRLMRDAYLRMGPARVRDAMSYVPGGLG